VDFLAFLRGEAARSNTDRLLSTKWLPVENLFRVDPFSILSCTAPSSWHFGAEQWLTK
jgi:hypothetical protein